jgi:two-component sensor histidine kinase
VNDQETVRRKSGSNRDKNREASEVKRKNLANVLVLFGGLIDTLRIGSAQCSRAYRLRASADHGKSGRSVFRRSSQQNESLYTIGDRNLMLCSCEKEWLMKEIHHRVKNNLQIVISLLSTQSNYIDNDIAYNAIRESQHRMQAISLIYQKLYQSENLARVDIRSYIAELVTYLRESFDTDPRIRFELDIVPLDLEVTRAVPLGLILNEAITNAIKYAFPDERTGKISICLKGIMRIRHFCSVFTMTGSGRR